MALFAAAGCGSSSSGGSCGNAAGCGGDVVGTWTITSSCVTVNESMFDSSCPGLTASGSNLSIRGSVTYNADGTYTANDTFSGTVSVHLPASCLTSNGVTATCDQLNQEFASNPTPGVTVSCSGSGTSGCTCLETVSGQSNTDTGTYTVASTGLLTETTSDGTVSQTDYCVKGTTMTQSPHPGSTMMGAESGTLTLSKS